MSDFDASKMLEALTEGDVGGEPERMTGERVVPNASPQPPHQGTPSVSASTKKKANRQSAPIALTPKTKTRTKTATNPLTSKDSGRVTNPSVDEEVAATSSSSARPEKARRGMARQLERSGRCPMHASVGTVCKSCGKVHPL